MHRRWWLPVIVLLLLAASFGYFFPQPPRVQLRPEPRAKQAGPVLVIAPHPDDETLAAAGMLQQTYGQGRPARVVMVTNGDGFRLAAERWAGRVRLSAQEMIAFGRHRQQETLRALSELGLSSEHVEFLGFPDGGVAPLWLEHWHQPYTSPFTKASASPYGSGTPYTGAALTAQLVRILEQYRPGLVIYPHPQDAHGDHWAIHNFTLAALEQVRQSRPDISPPEERLYLVHRGGWPAPKGLHPQAELLPPRTLLGGLTQWGSNYLQPGQVEQKLEAIESHRSQVWLMRRYLVSFARKSELYGTLPHVALGPEHDPVLGWTPAVSDPTGDTVKRGLAPSADATGVDAALNGTDLLLRLRLRAAPEPGSSYRLYLRGFRPGTGWSIETSVDWQGRAPEEGVEAMGRSVIFRVPLAHLNNPTAVMAGFSTRFRGLVVDQTGWRLLHLP